MLTMLMPGGEDSFNVKQLVNFFNASKRWCVRLMFSEKKTYFVPKQKQLSLKKINLEGEFYLLF